ncbi:MULTISPECIES: TlpA family protein disulfide reductase [Sphingobacterium]|uniref:TlpA family protein disulfide reductase n=1 Tax=Sphingobacterium TaxID=28453 RepID=UPI00122FE9E7|nr:MULTISPECIES: TlpA disulfide reductase family protein [Sphingobacterium]
MRKRLKLGLVAVLSSFVFVYCGQAENRAKTTTTKEEVSAANVEPTQSVISFKNEKGEVVTLDDLKGKAIFINFWATWCPPCIEEMPSIQTLYNKFKDNKDIVFLLVDVDNNIKSASKFMNKRKLDMPLYVPNSEIPSSFLAGAIPTTVILDKKGNIDVRLEGGRDYSTPAIAEALQSLMDE